MTKQYECPVDAAIDAIGGKWKVLIIYALMNRVKRFVELHRYVPDTTKKMLTQQLRELERDGIVLRVVYPQIPPKVEYSLTEYGNTLKPILKLLCEWGENHMKYRNELSDEMAEQS